MRTTITLPDPVYENAKVKAQARGISLSEYIHEALLAEMHRPAPRKDSAFRLPTAPGGFAPGIDINKTSALIVMEDEEQYGQSR